MSGHREMVTEQFETAYRAACTIVRNLWSTDLIRSQAEYNRFKGYQIDMAIDIYKTYHGYLSNADLAIIQAHCEASSYYNS